MKVQSPLLCIYPGLCWEIGLSSCLLRRPSDGHVWSKVSNRQDLEIKEIGSSIYMLRTRPSQRQQSSQKSEKRQNWRRQFPRFPNQILRTVHANLFPHETPAFSPSITSARPRPNQPYLVIKSVYRPGFPLCTANMSASLWGMLMGHFGPKTMDGIYFTCDTGSLWDLTELWG